MTFIHDDRYQFEFLRSTESEEEGRRYITPQGNIYPSVTTVLSSETDQGLLDWRERVGEEEADRITKMSQEIGETVHFMIEKYLDNIDPVSLFPQLVKHSTEMVLFNQIKPYLDNISCVFNQETPLYSDYLKVAGRVDCIGVYNGKRSIIDFKTANSWKQPEYVQKYFMQCACYAVMFEELQKAPITQLVVLVTGIEGPQVFIEQRDNFIGQFMEMRVKYNKETGI